MTTLTNIYETDLIKFKTFKKHTDFFEKNVDQIKSKFYKHQKEQLRMSWNDALLKLNSPHANDYDIYDEVA